MNAKVNNNIGKNFALAYLIRYIQFTGHIQTSYLNILLPEDYFDTVSDFFCRPFHYRE